MSPFNVEEMLSPRKNQKNKGSVKGTKDRAYFAVSGLHVASTSEQMYLNYIFKKT